VARAGADARTVRRRITSLRALWKWLLLAGRAKRDPLLAIAPPRVERSPLPVLSVEEVAHLLNLPGDEVLDVRDRALLEVLYATGAPLQEIAALRLGDVGARIIELSLGRDTRLERRVPLGRAAQRALTAYLQVRPQLADAERETDSLWLCGRGVPMSGPRIYQTVRERGREAGLGNRASPSALRRACALHLLSAGAAPGDVTVLLGFSSVSALARLADL
jgi:integrase/recombinase XerD